jgi:cell fate regulator YaaT (PSP1 superfamily)
MYINHYNTSESNSLSTKIVEVAFKAGRIGIFANRAGLALQPEQYVVVEAEKGEDLGKIVQSGETYGYNVEDDALKNVLRVATPEDLERLQRNRELEEQAIRECKMKIIEHHLNMNLVDAEFQFDHKKLTFYFTSEQRVDFRKLVRDLAGKYHTRIELRQIGVRDAAKHVGGYGTCGCQLCCTVFLRKFENITTQYIKDQLIPMSPSRLTGVCGRLKCCLAYERDYYLEELAKMPAVGETVTYKEISGVVEKVDIFNRTVYLRTEDDDIVRIDTVTSNVIEDVSEEA